MSKRRRPVTIVVFCAFLLAFRPAGLAQRGSPWQAYRLSDGLPESACLAVSVTPQGRVLVRHPDLPRITELDGYGVNVIPAPEKSVGRVYGSPAGQLWTVSDGGLEAYQSGVWTFHPVPEVAVEFQKGAPRLIDPIPLWPVRQGVVLLLLSDALVEFSIDAAGQSRIRPLLTAAAAGLETFTGMCAASDEGLWVAGRRGFCRTRLPARSLTPESEWEHFMLPGDVAMRALLEPHEDERGGVVAVGETGEPGRERLVVHYNSGHWRLEGAGRDRLRHAWSTGGQTLWGITIDRLLWWDAAAKGFAEADEISARQYWDVAIEKSGDFWLATSDGLFRHALLPWQTPLALRGISSPVNAVTSGSESLWFITTGAIHWLRGEEAGEVSFPDRLRSLQPPEQLSFLSSGQVLLWGAEGAWLFDPERREYRELDEVIGSRGPRPLGALRDGQVCVEIGAPEQPGDLELARFDGVRLEKLPPLRGLGAGVHALRAFTARDGDLWISTDSEEIACLRNGAWRVFPPSGLPGPVIEFAETAAGRLWAATRDQLWAFDGKVWSSVRGGFDRINSLVSARDGSVWLGSNSGLFRLYKETWIEFGVDEGLPGTAIRDVQEDARGRIWAATARGLSEYHPGADVDPPRTTIHPPPGGVAFREGAAVTFSFAGRDRWKYTPRDRLLFSRRLDSGDWSSFSETDFVTLPDLAGGRHFLQVRAMDRSGNVETTPAQIEFSVILPWYREARLVLIATAGSALALFFAGLALNRHLRLVRSYAEVERKVAERSAELEQANRELLQSQKMRALGTLAAGVAHDFNNILSIIKGSAQIIEDNLADAAKVQTRLERIKLVVDQGTGLVRAMLGFSRDSDQLPLGDLNGVVEDTLKLLGDRFMREVEVRFSPGVNLPPAPVSKDFVQQILLNFIFNAAEAKPRDRRVLLRTGILEKLPRGVALMPPVAARYLMVSVRDHGAGIPPENVSRLFEPFFTTKALSSRRGTGLGLSMAYELAKKMNAGLAVESLVGEGSTFTLILPLPAADSGGADDYSRK